MDIKYKKAFKKFAITYILVLFVLIAILAYMLDIANWQDLSTDKIINVKQTLSIYDRNNNLVSFLNAGENRTKIKISELPDYVKYAFVSAEDARFFEHKGVDVIRIVGAAIEDIKAGYYKEGASTITQQLVKNSQLTNDKKMSRKLQEALLAYQLEKRYNKEEILEMYLNFVYFGNRAYGIESAALTYFNKHAKDLTLAEAALLAGVLKSPSRYAPHINPENSVKRRNLVLSLMLKYGHISQEEYETAKNEPLKLDQNAAFEYKCGFYMDMVLRDAAKILEVDIEDVLSGGYSIYTNLDTDLQLACEELYKDTSLFPKNSKDGEAAQSALVIIDNKTNGILAVMGGREYSARLCLNRATSMKRAPGSTVKPLIVYGPAFEEHLLTPASILLDQRTDFNGYSPENFDNKYSGNVTVREALINSLNVPAVSAMNMLGVEKAKAYGEKLGITFDEKDNNLALALGGFTYGLSPLQVANAYSALANNGFYTPACSINKIVDSNGKTVYSATPTGTRVFSAETAFLLTDILCDAAKKSKNSHFYTANYQVAIKTGTVGYEATNGYMDAWAAAYTPEYTVVVWNGFDKTDENHYLPKGATGSSYPSAQARKVFDELYKNSQPATFVKPEGIVAIEIDKRALYTEGVVATATENTPNYYKLVEYFAADNSPNNPSAYWSKPNPPKDLKYMINELRQPVISFLAENSYISYQIYRIGKDKTEMLTQLKGKAGSTMRYVDKSAVPGETYEYFVLPVHEEVYVNGKPLTGNGSEKLTVRIPA